MRLIALLEGFYMQTFESFNENKKTPQHELRGFG